MQLSQNIFNGWGTTSQTAQAEAGVFAKMAEFYKTEQDVLVEAASAYLNLWLKEAVLQLTNKNVDLKTATLEQVKARSGVGELTLTDVAQAEAELAAAISKRINAQAEMINALATYERVISDSPPKELSPPRDFIGALGLPKTLNDAIEIALKNDPSIQNAIYVANSADAAIDVARATLLPTVDASVTGSRSLQGRNPDSRESSTEVLLQLKIPIYQGGAEYAKVRSARQSLVKAKVDVSAARKKTVELVNQVWERLRSAKEQIEQTKIRIDAQILTLEGVRQEFMVGEKTTKDVLDAENNLVQAETDFINAEQVYFLAAYQLLYAIGSLNPRYLELPVQPYPIQAQYEQIRGKLVGFAIAPERG